LGFRLNPYLPSLQRTKVPHFEFPRSRILEQSPHKS
jgi:hypothetical protein